MPGSGNPRGHALARNAAASVVSSARAGLRTPSNTSCRAGNSRGPPATERDSARPTEIPRRRKAAAGIPEGSPLCSLPGWARRTSGRLGVGSSGETRPRTPRRRRPCSETRFSRHGGGLQSERVGASLGPGALRVLTGNAPRRDPRRGDRRREAGRRSRRNPASIDEHDGALAALSLRPARREVARRAGPLVPGLWTHGRP